ncbi:hypothetical protein HK096_003934 [Nowakowskiella sp. JEL0078]|nr:hypothetical protein HK096_003934 [Nowakowskiella sp. JEL0078]
MNSRPEVSIHIIFGESSNTLVAANNARASGLDHSETARGFITKATNAEQVPPIPTLIFQLQTPTSKPKHRRCIKEEIKVENHEKDIRKETKKKETARKMDIQFLAKDMTMKLKENLKLKSKRFIWSGDAILELVVLIGQLKNEHEIEEKQTPGFIS